MKLSFQEFLVLRESIQHGGAYSID